MIYVSFCLYWSGRYDIIFIDQLSLPIPLLKFLTRAKVIIHFDILLFFSYFFSIFAIFVGHYLWIFLFFSKKITIHRILHN